MRFDCVAVTLQPRSSLSAADAGRVASRLVRTDLFIACAGIARTS